MTSSYLSFDPQNDLNIHCVQSLNIGHVLYCKCFVYIHPVNSQYDTCPNIRSQKNYTFFDDTG